jgi:hypothetical protein
MIQKMKSFFTGLNTLYTYIISSKILFLFTIILIFFFGKYFNDIQEYLTFQAYLFREALLFTYDYFFSSPIPTNISETENIIKSESNYPSKKKILIICGITAGIILTGVSLYCFVPAVAPLVNATAAATLELATTTTTDFSSLTGFLGSLFSSVIIINDIPLTTPTPPVNPVSISISQTSYIDRFVNLPDVPNEELNPTSSSSNFERGVMSHGQVIDYIDTFLDN